MSADTVVTFPRAEFLSERWLYRPGQHVTILAPTDCGKTQLAFELVSWYATPKLPAVCLVKKPYGKDQTVIRWEKELKFKRVDAWPPALPYPKPPGWIVWPKTAYDPAVDDPRAYHLFRRAMLDSYKRGKRILFADEVMGLVRLGLTSELETVWMEARSTGCGLWAATQRPAGVPLAAYSMASHLFLGPNPDQRDQKRYSEIGGVDPKLVSSVVSQLTPFQFLYVKRRGKNSAEMCVVDK